MRRVLTQRCAGCRLTRHSSGKTSASFLSISTRTQRRVLHISGRSPTGKKQIVCSRSFGERITDKDAMHRLLFSMQSGPQRNYVGSVSMPAGGDIYTNVTLCSESPLLRNSAVEKLPLPTQDSRDIIAQHAER